MNRKDVLKSSSYWFEYEQNELYRQVMSYMEREGINRTQLAKRLKVSKGYVSQILNGNYNYTLKKWIELCLSIGIVPNGYKKIEEIINEDVQFAVEKSVVFPLNYKQVPLAERISGEAYSVVVNITNFQSSQKQIDYQKEAVA